MGAPAGHSNSVKVPCGYRLTLDALQLPCGSNTALGKQQGQRQGQRLPLHCAHALLCGTHGDVV